MHRIKAVSEELGQRINKTKVVVVDRAGCLPTSNALKEYEKVDSFVYLGSTIAGGRVSAEIRRRIALGKTAMTKRNRKISP